MCTESPTLCSSYATGCCERPSSTLEDYWQEPQLWVVWHLPCCSELHTLEDDCSPGRWLVSNECCWVKLFSVLLPSSAAGSSEISQWWWALPGSHFQEQKQNACEMARSPYSGCFAWDECPAVSAVGAVLAPQCDVCIHNTVQPTISWSQGEAQWEWREIHTGELQVLWASPLVWLCGHCRL